MAITTSSSVNPAAYRARPETGRGWSAVMGRSLGEARLPRSRSQGSSQAPSMFAAWHAAGRVTCLSPSADARRATDLRAGCRLVKWLDAQPIAERVAPPIVGSSHPADVMVTSHVHALRRLTALFCAAPDCTSTASSSPTPRPMIPSCHRLGPEAPTAHGSTRSSHQAWHLWPRRSRGALSTPG
jgi:hypothetical protein